MGIAYSKLPIITATIRADTSAHFRADIETNILAAGWTKIRSITNGAVYECTTPDVHSFKARLKVQDQGTSGFAGGWIIFQGLTHDETGAGQGHTILWGNGFIPIYQVLIGVCQFFLSIPGSAGSVVIGDQSFAFAFGVPSVPINIPGSSCDAGIGSGAAVTDIWWANGPGNQAFFVCQNFRTAPRCFQCFDFSLNNAVTIQDGSGGAGQDPSQGMLTLFYLTETLNVDAFYAQQPVTKHGSGLPINLDALIGWLWTIRGQLWDAFLRSRAESLDSIQTYRDLDAAGNEVLLTCKVWMSSFYCSLLLMTVSPPANNSGTWNVAY